MVAYDAAARACRATFLPTGTPASRLASRGSPSSAARTPRTNGRDDAGAAALPREIEADAGHAQTLATQTRGLALVARRGESRARISRLLLLSDDGAERLYRHAEALAAAHAPRVLVAVVAADAAAHGRATTARDAAVKVVLVRHKQAVAALMRALIRPAASTGSHIR